jgi:hypothetical protein
MVEMVHLGVKSPCFSTLVEILKSNHIELTTLDLSRHPLVIILILFVVLLC